MSNNKQTAVDWQFDQLSSENLLGLFTYDQMKRAMEILEQAKAIHEEETLDFANKAVRMRLDEDIQNPTGLDDLYNETFRGNNKL